MAEGSKDSQFSVGDDECHPMADTERSKCCNSKATILKWALCVSVFISIIVIAKWVYRMNHHVKLKCPEYCKLGGFDIPNPSLLDYGRSVLDVKLLDKFKDADNNTEEQCCPDIGCFDTDYPFDVLPVPECVNISEIRFTLFRDYRSVGEIKYKDEVPEAYSGKSQTVFIIHGFFGGKSGWVKKMADALVNSDPEVDVIGVDWIHYASRYFYSQSAANTRAIGAYTALIINQLVLQRNVSYNSVWCIGHSLGAHACGYIGLSVARHFGHKIGRITGLDPAGHCFECQDTTDIGLNENCAELVEVVHTDTTGVIGNFGTKRPLGHVDFYPNGLQNQPGCQTRKRKRRSIVSCSHSRAYKLFIDAIDQHGACKSTKQCSDVDKIPESCTECPAECPALGFHQPQYNNQTSGMYYLETSSSAPYCLV